MKPHIALQLAYLELAIAQICISINTIVAKVLMPIMPAFLIIAIRFTLSAILLSSLMHILKVKTVSRQHPTGILERQDKLYLIIQGLTAGVLFNLFFIEGVARTTAVSAGIIGSALPPMVAILSYFFLKERISTETFWAIILAMVGIAVISLNNAEGPSHITGSYLGDFLVFLALIPEAVYSLMSRLTSQRITAFGAATWANWTAALCSWPIALLYWPENGWQLVTDWWVLGMIGIVSLSGVFFYVCWAHALKFIPVSIAGIFGGLMPVATAFFAWILLGERLTRYDWISLLFVLISIWLGTRGNKAKPLTTPAAPDTPAV